MNNFLKKEKTISRTTFIKKNYGLSLKSLSFLLKKRSTSSIFLTKKSLLSAENILNVSANFNRSLKLIRKKRIEEIKKQSSWKSLRFRQSLPVNGQRTHTNANVSKKMNNNMYFYDI